MIDGQDFSIYEGNTKIVEIEISSDDGQSLEGASVKWVCGTIEKSGTVSEDVFSFRIEPDDTIGKAGSRFIHEAQVTDTQGNVSTILRGVMIVKRTII